MSHRFSLQRGWAPYVWLAAIALIGPAVFLIGQPAEFAQDDAYIHFQYARNLAETGQLTFNSGEARGIGTTSLLWALLLAGGMKLGISLAVAARIMGIGALAVATICVYELALPLFAHVSAQRARPGAFIAAALFALSGNMIWFTLSGMETTQFLVVALLTFVCYQRQWWPAVGMCIGLAVLSRPEGLGLMPAIVLLELFRVLKGGRMLWGQWATAALLAAIPIGGWALYVHECTGQWLPTTFAGKRVYHADVTRHFLAAVPALALYTGSLQVVYLVQWVGYALLYVFGVATVPGPRLVLTQEIGTDVSINISVIGAALVALVVAPLLWLGAREALRFARSSGDMAPARLGTVGLWLWAAMHNGAYLVLFPSMGTATRYQAINHLLLWWLVALGLAHLWPQRKLFVAASVAVAIIVLADVSYWRGVHAANLDHMESVRITAARYVDRELPEGTRMAAYDIGAMGYYCRHPIVDLGGLIDSEFTRYQQTGAVDQYLRDRGAQYLAVPDRHSTQDRAIFDFAEYLGLDDSRLFGLTEIIAFENDYKVWQRGSEATGGYQPSVRIYKIDWRDPLGD